MSSSMNAATAVIVSASHRIASRALPPSCNPTSGLSTMPPTSHGRSFPSVPGDLASRRPSGEIEHRKRPPGRTKNEHMFPLQSLKVILCGLLAAVCIGAAPTPASATEPLACTNEPTVLDATIPSSVVDGRATPIPLEKTYAGDLVEGSLTLSVVPKGAPAEPDLIADEDYDQYVLDFTTKDGPQDVTWSWVEHHSSTPADCRRTVSKTVPVVRGTAPKNFYEVHTFDNYGPNWVQFTIPRPRHCYAAATGAITVTVSKGNAARRAVLSDQCKGRWNRLRHSPSGWRTTSHINYSRSKATFAFRTAARRNARETFTYRITWRGKTLARGKVIAHTVYKPAREIFEGTDAFVNYCINDSTARIYSRGGRLYCYYPGKLTHRYTLR